MSLLGSNEPPGQQWRPGGGRAVQGLGAQWGPCDLEACCAVRGQESRRDEAVLRSGGENRKWQLRAGEGLPRPRDTWQPSPGRCQAECAR